MSKAVEDKENHHVDGKASSSSAFKSPDASSEAKPSRRGGGGGGMFGRLLGEVTNQIKTECDEKVAVKLQDQDANSLMNEWLQEGLPHLFLRLLSSRHVIAPPVQCATSRWHRNWGHSWKPKPKTRPKRPKRMARRRRCNWRWRSGAAWLPMRRRSASARRRTRTWQRTYTTKRSTCTTCVSAMTRWPRSCTTRRCVCLTRGCLLMCLPPFMRAVFVTPARWRRRCSRTKTAARRRRGRSRMHWRGPMRSLRRTRRTRSSARRARRRPGRRRRT